MPDDTDEEPDASPFDAGTPDSPEVQPAFVEGIEGCARRFVADEAERVACFAAVVGATIGRRSSERSRTVVPADEGQSRARGDARARATLAAKRRARNGASETVSPS